MEAGITFGKGVVASPFCKKLRSGHPKASVRGVTIRKKGCQGVVENWGSASHGRKK